MCAMLGCYSHRPRERRYFGAFYLLIRVTSVLILMMLSPLLSALCSLFYLTFAVVLVAFFRPYKKNWHNVIDILLFSSILYACLVISYFQDSSFLSPLLTFSLFGLHFYDLSYVIASFVFLYGVWLFLYKTLPSSLTRKLLKCAYSLNCFRRENVELQDGVNSMDTYQREPLLD